MSKGKSRVEELHERLERIESARFFPAACIDIADNAIRKCFAIENSLIGWFELAWRRGFQAGEMGISTLDPKLKKQLLEVLRAVGTKSDMATLGADGAVILDNTINDEIRALAYRLAQQLEAAPKRIKTEAK